MATLGRNISQEYDASKNYNESNISYGAPSVDLSQIAQAEQVEQVEQAQQPAAQEAPANAIPSNIVESIAPTQSVEGEVSNYNREIPDVVSSAIENSSIFGTRQAGVTQGQQPTGGNTTMTTGAPTVAPQAVTDAGMPTNPITPTATTPTTAAASAVSSAVASSPATSLSTQAAVPAVPTDTNINPSVSAGRARTAVSDQAINVGRQVQPAMTNANVLQDDGVDQQNEIVADEEEAVAVANETVQSETDSMHEQRRQREANIVQDTVIDIGSFEAPQPMNTLSRANRRFKAARKFIQEKISSQLKAENRVGRSAFHDTITASKNVNPDSVSIGAQNLIEALRDPGSSIIALVNNANPGLNLTAEACLDNIGLLVNAINLSNIEVVFSKSPVNTKGSVQVRTLHAHYGSGIQLHPTQTKSYNADFDGDTGNLNTDQSNLKNHSRAMSLLVDAEGQPTIDPDFFPLDYLALPSSQDMKDLIESMKERNFAWEPSIASRIAGAYIDACNKGDWVGLLRQLDKIAGDGELQAAHGMYRSQLASRILKSLYDYAIDRRGLNLSVEWANVVDNYIPTELDSNAHFMTQALVDKVVEIAQGVPAPNFQDFTAFFNKQYGDLSGQSVGGKNVPFRLLADFAKAINRTDLISVGDPVFGTEADGDTVTLYELWQFTCSAGVSKLVSGRIHMGSHELASKTQVKSIVLRTLAQKYDGSPVPRWTNDYQANQETFRQWMKDFQKAYNSQMRMWNVAQVKFRGGMGIERGNTGKYDGFKDFKDPAFAKAFVEVFGDYSMERVFPGVMLGYGRDTAGGRENTNSGIIRRYQAMSVSDFSVYNRLDWYSEGVITDEDGNIIGSKTKVEEMNKRFDNGSFVPMDVVMAVADRRSKQFGDYETSWLKATSQHVHILQQIRDDISKDNFSGYAYDMLELIHLMSPRMFNHFGMDSPITFAKSKWGKKLLAAETESEFRSVLVSMTVEYRFGRASNLQKQIKELQEEELHDENYATKLAAADAHYQNEMKQLASSSMAWESIVSEIEGKTNAFQQLLKDKKIEKGSNRTFHLVAQEFWNNTNPEDQYSLINFLKSDAAYDIKMAVLCDVVKFNTGIDNGINVKHMIGMLAHDPDPLFAGSKFEMDSGIKTVTDSVKDSVNRITSYRSQSPSTIAKQANKIIRSARENKSAFEARLLRFANDPGYYIYLDTVLAADAISSIYEKTYDDSEKIHQQSLVNGYFEALSLQRSGGFYTHLQQTDNAVVNTIGFDQLTNLDIVRILGDPSIELRGYDEFGVPCVYSRATLCGGDTIDDVLNYLEDHPRVALACRRHMVGVNYNSKKPSESSASLSILDDSFVGDSHSNRVFALLNDRPRYLAIAALMTPTQGNVGRNLAERVNENIRNLNLFIMDEAASGRNGTQILDDIEDFFGLADDESFDAMVLRLRNEGAFDELEFNLDDYEAAWNMFSDVASEIASCVDIVRESGIKLVHVPDDAISHEKIDIDRSSMIAYYDARQQLNGARTEKMIGIEGSETKKNLVLREFVRNRSDRYMTVAEDMGYAAVRALSEASGIDIQQELEASEDGMIVIEVPENWNNEDWSLEHNPQKNVGSIAKFLEIKREKGAETFNAKSKKFGDDGTNSIIKFLKYGTKEMLRRYGKKSAWSVEQGSQLLQQISQCETKDEAIPILADALMQADARLGYIDINDVFQKSDYWNRADLMIVEQVDENGNVSLYVRTLEQLAVAFRNRISDEAILSENADTVLQELTQLNEVIGTPADPMFNNGVDIMTLDDVRVTSGTGNINRINRALRPYSSSTERTYTLVYQLFRLFGQDEFSDKDYIMPSRERIVQQSNYMFKLLDNKVRDLIKGVAYPHDKWVKGEDGYYEQVLDPDGSREHIYDYLGRPQDKDFFLIPGPQSLVYFDEDSDIAILDRCEKYGVTAAFTNMSLIPDKYVEDAIVLEGVVILPFFDMRLNGSMAEPIAPAPGQWFFSANNVITSVEDTTYEIAPGDASAQSTNEGLDKIHFNLNGTEVFDAFDLFPAILRNDNGEFADMPCKIEKADTAEIRRWVLSGEGTIDYGIHEDNPKFAREVRRFNIRMREYARMFEAGQVDEYGMISPDVDCHYDSIVGFVKLKIGADNYAFAPIIPFQLEQSSRVFKQMKTTSKKPSKFRIDDFHVDPEGLQFNMRWRFTDDVRGHYIKFFEGIGASNKFMIHANEVAKSRALANGTPVDMIYSTKSVASRLFPVNKRIHTLISMLMIPRIDSKYAYNFAELPGAFPGMPDFKAALLEGTLTRDDWAQMVKSSPDVVYYEGDEEINNVVKWLVEKCVKPGVGYQTVNPSILLSTRTASGIMPPIATEFEAFLDSGYNFQNALMHLMHEMCPTLVPANIEDSSKNTLFKPVKKGSSTDEDYGVLQMMVPYYREDGQEYKIAENVYISFGFFGDEFSGFKKVNFNAAQRGIDDLNVSANLDGFDLSQVMSFARAGMASVPSLNKMEPAEDNVMGENNLPHRINPDMDGVDHINVYSQGQTDLGKFLSNFAKTPIDTPEGHFESIEGYWHYLGLPSDCPGRKKLKQLSGYEARKLGRELRKQYGTTRRDDFKDKIREAIRIKLEKYKSKWINEDYLLPLEHYYVNRNGDINDQRKQFGWLTDILEEEMDNLAE